jgi:hypothetical protein
MIEASASPPPTDRIEAFIARWQGREGGQERANYAMFLSELCTALDLKQPDPADATRERNDYVFERAVDMRQPDGVYTTGRIDLYKRGCFVLEAKQSRKRAGREPVHEQLMLEGLASSKPETRGRRSARRGWDTLMWDARNQAENYAKALPGEWPPFLMVCDVGHCIEIYADFSGQGKNYAQFPDRQGFRCFIEDLRQEKIRDRLRGIWLDPHSLDPTRNAARATREIAGRLAAVSKSLEAKAYPAETVAMFLMRCLFTMFAEDVSLLPDGSFADLLEFSETAPTKFPNLIEDLWRAMNIGDFASSIRAQVKKFNGNLFADARALPLGREEIGELRQAAKQDWTEVEPAIFGTLLEQALDAHERKRLGAHYTPRAYVQKLVAATMIEPLRAEWGEIQGTVELQKSAGDAAAAIATVKAFHETLLQTRVLDPACGTGNFLYVALELLKRLEGEVLEALADLGGQEVLTGLEGSTVDPHQFLGLELNTRAAAIAELVLWIGYLQWHFRTKGAAPAEPILKAFKNINNGGKSGGIDAVLAYDGEPELVRDEFGKPVTRQGEDGSRVEIYRYSNPRRPVWPAADYIIGNPPFIGGKDIRGRLGEGYAEALWAAHPQIKPSADFVMYWWDHAADLLTRKSARLKRFGFVTTNSITQEFSRRVMARHLKAKKPISLVMAIPDHPWTKATRDAAAVRIAMSVAVPGKIAGKCFTVTRETGLETDEPVIETTEAIGTINPDLTVGADVTTATALKSNDYLCSPGVKLHGDGFIIDRRQAAHLGLGRRAGLDAHIREYRNGRDLTSIPRHAMVIDLLGLGADEVRLRFPEVYQHLLGAVKPERDQNNRNSYRENWWIFGEPRRELRPALYGFPRYIATVETAKHRIFQFLDTSILPDNKLIATASKDAFDLGVLSSHIHTHWAVRAGGWLGMGNDPVYVKTKCFDPFPFPAATEAQKAAIRAVAEELDAHRKARQDEHPGLTITQMYNVLEKLKAGATLTIEEERINSEGLVLILRELHDRLDALVFDAYGWPATLTDDEILARLVALNAERAAEEKRGLIRWLRPDYQMERAGLAAVPQAAEDQGELGLATAAARKPLFPATPREQVGAVFAALAEATAPLDAAGIAATFRQGRKVEAKVEATLGALARTGLLSATEDGQRYWLPRSA